MANPLSDGLVCPKIPGIRGFQAAEKVFCDPTGFAMANAAFGGKTPVGSEQTQIAIVPVRTEALRERIPIKAMQIVWDAL